MLPRIKKGDHGMGLGIDTRQIWALVKIAMLASESEIVEVASTAVFERDYVFDMKRKRIILLVELAVFATVGSTGGNRCADSVIHDLTQ